MPLRLRLLVAWSAGPSAAAKAGWSQQRLEKEAWHALTRILELPEDALGRRFVRSYFHDWQADKFSREHTATCWREEWKRKRYSRCLWGTACFLRESRPKATGIMQLYMAPIPADCVWLKKF